MAPSQLAFINKETSRLLLSGHNQRWYRQKNYCLDQLCFVGRGSAKHEKQWRNIERRRSSKGELLQHAGTSLEQQSLMLSLGQPENTLSCSVDVGSIGHGRNNFNHITYCLEKVLDERTGAWLAKPLPSTLLPPHFFEQLPIKQLLLEPQTKQFLSSLGTAAVHRALFQ